MPTAIPLCCTVSADLMRDIDHFRGDLTRADWLAQLVTLHVQQLNHLALRDYAKSASPSFQGFIGSPVRAVPRPHRAHVDWTLVHQTADDNKEQKRLAQLHDSSPEVEPEDPSSCKADVHIHSPQPLARFSGQIKYRCEDPDCEWVSGWI